MRVLGHATVSDVGNSRLVGRTWRDAIDEHAVELWEACCEVFGILTTRRKRSFLAHTAKGVRYKVELLRAVKAPDMRWQLVVTYRRYYYDWARRICRTCEPSELGALRSCCKKPSAYTWMVIHEELANIVRRAAPLLQEAERLLADGQARRVGGHPRARALLARFLGYSW